MAISQAKLKGNLGAIADYFLDVDTDLGDYYLAEDGEPSTAPPWALRPVTGAGASAWLSCAETSRSTVAGGAHRRRPATTRWRLRGVARVLDVGFMEIEGQGHSPQHRSCDD